MVSSIHLESVLVNELAERIGKARKLYGKDSSYVIGLVTAIEWIAVGAEGGESLKQDLLDSFVMAIPKNRLPGRFVRVIIPEEGRPTEGRMRPRIRRVNRWLRIPGLKGLSNGLTTIRGMDLFLQIAKSMSSSTGAIFHHGTGV